MLIDEQLGPAHRVGLAAVVPGSLQGMAQCINNILCSELVAVTAQQPLQCRQADRAGKFQLARCEVSRDARQRLWIARARPRKLSRFGEKPRLFGRDKPFALIAGGSVDRTVNRRANGAGRAVNVLKGA